MPQLEKLHEYLNLNQRDTEYNRIFMSYITLFFSLAFFVIFIPIDMLILPNPLFSSSLALLALTCAGTIYYLFSSNNIETVSLLTTIILAVFLSVLAFMGTPHASTFTMSIIFPGVAFFLLGHRRGALSIFLFFPVFSLLLWWNITTSARSISQANVAINTILPFGLVTLQLFYNELARKGANDEKERLLGYLEILSSKDSLTGLWNRRLSDEFLEQEIARSQRQGSNLSVGIIDIDHFKKVNDTYGHAAGDTVLKEIAHEFRNIVRTHDRVGRWGGEEFIVICSETGLEDAVELFKRMRSQIEDHTFSNGLKVTISIGIAEYRASDSPSTLTVRADKALYHAKQQGRNRVCTYKQFIEGNLGESNSPDVGIDWKMVRS